MRDRAIPEATVGRLPVYLRSLVEMAERGAVTVSSGDLAEAAGVNSAKVRKDLSYLGSYGTRGVGYDVAYLIHQVRRELGLTQDWPVLIAGAWGLAFLVSVARWTHVLAPIAEGLLAIGGAILGKDLLRGERTLEALGLAQCSHEELFRLLEG